MPGNTLGLNWQQTHTLARLFFATNNEPLLELWEHVRAGRELRPSVWTEFVEHPELWALITHRTRDISEVTLELWASSELAEEGHSLLALTIKEEYLLICLAPHAASPHPVQFVASKRAMFTREYAIQRFLATVLIYVFVHIYGGECRVTYISHEPLNLNPNNIYTPFT